MASLLRQIVAGPRARHPEAGLDLCYVTDNIIATSGPSDTYPQLAYRNPLDQLVKFLDSKHGKNWAIWEFRAEGTGYPDDAVYNRIRHYPWPDHHPPPFRLIPMIMASMRNWLNGNDLHDDVSQEDSNNNNLIGKVLEAWKDKNNPRVIVVHCKAGKGRSGTSACSFLISECGWTPEEALGRFTERRMRPKFGPGVSIPSQLRWVGYVDRWTKGGKKYVDRELEIVEVHVWGLRNGVKFAVEGFVDEGKKIKVFHTYKKEERRVVEGDAPGSAGIMDTFYSMAGWGVNPSGDGPGLKPDQEQDVVDSAKTANPENDPVTAGTKSDVDSPISPNSGPSKLTKRYSKLISPVSRNSSTRSVKRSKSKKEKALQKVKSSGSSTSSLASDNKAQMDTEPGGQAVIFKTAEPIRLPTSDVNITAERRNRAPSSMGLTMVTAVAHVWFNTFFEGNGPEQDGKPEENGVFEIEWDKLDGIKGSSQKGTRAFDRMAVVWRFADSPQAAAGVVISEPAEGESVPQMKAADWKGEDLQDPGLEKKLGLRVQSPESASVSQASSIRSVEVGSKGKGADDVDSDSMKGVKSDIGGATPAAVDAKVEKEEACRGRKGKEVAQEDQLAAYAEKLPSPEGSESSGKPEKK
ncbi:Telomerase protein component 1 [Pestalotiopsis sp. IQ-011]